VKVNTHDILEGVRDTLRGCLGLTVCASIFRDTRSEYISSFFPLFLG